jgi:uncharacterized protein YecT (DUF1311 family)
MNGRNRPPEWPVGSNQEAGDEPEIRRRDTEVVRTGGRSGLSWTTIALIGGLILLIIVIGYFATRGNPDQDKLTGTDTAADNAAAVSDPSKLCASNGTYESIKHDLFRRAAQVRGSDQAAFDTLSNYASLRMEHPVMESQDESTGAVNCSGSLSLDLPPGVAIVGGRRTLTADVDYTVQPAADGSGNVVLLRNADAIITPLATLAKVSQPEAQPGAEEPDVDDVEVNVAASESANKEVGPQTDYPGRPSFDCSNAQTKGEIAVCSDSGLSALDVNMATQYRRALGSASPEERAILQRTRDRFLAYRDRCPNRSCIADAYVGRMKEIRDIMEGNWQPPR